MWFFKYILLMCLFGSLTACGFKLYGNDTLPPQMHTLYYQAANPHGQFETALKNALKSSGVHFTNTAREAPVTMNVIRTSFTHDNPNVVSSAQATLYNFTYSATFNLLDSKGKPIIDPQTVTSTRTITLNPNDVIESNPEVDTAKGEMSREMIFKAFNILDAKNTRKDLAKTVKLDESTTRKLTQPLER